MTLELDAPATCARRARRSASGSSPRRHAGPRLRGRARERHAPDRRPQRPDRLPAPPPEGRRRALVDAGHPPRGRAPTGCSPTSTTTGADQTLGSNLTVEGETELAALPAPARAARTGAGYRVGLEGEAHRPARRASSPSGHPRRRDGRRRALPGRRRSPGRPARGRPRLPARPSEGRRRARGSASRPSSRPGRLPPLPPVQARGEVRTAEFTVDVPG